MKVTASDVSSCSAIDVIELVAIKLGLKFYKASDCEISVVSGTMESGYILLVEWRQDFYEALYFSCDIGLDVSPKNQELITAVIAKANERSWLGHFDLMSSDHRVVYSFTMPFASSFNFDEINVESILKIITDECDRFRQFFEMSMNTDQKEGMSDLSINTLFFEALGEA